MSERISNPDLVHKILRDEDLYTDSEPSWLEGRSKKPCQTAEAANNDRKLQIKRARRAGKKDPEAIKLAERLESCAIRNRCASPACPECHRAFQRWYVRGVAHLMTYLTGDRAEGLRFLHPIPTFKIDEGKL